MKQRELKSLDAKELAKVMGGSDNGQPLPWIVTKPKPDGTSTQPLPW